jgi:hypothetical protein
MQVYVFRFAHTYFFNLLERSETVIIQILWSYLPVAGQVLICHHPSSNSHLVLENLSFLEVQL